MSRVLLCLCTLTLAASCGAPEPGLDRAQLEALLTSRARDPARHAPVAALAAYRLGDLKALDSAPALARAMTTHPDAEVRHASAVGLCAMGCLDAVPLLIDAAQDSFGVCRPLFAYLRWLASLLGRDIESPTGSDRGELLAWQAELRSWWAQNEERLRTERSQAPGSAFPKAVYAAAHDQATTTEGVAGIYVGHPWEDEVVLQLREDGTFEMRGGQGRGASVRTTWPRTGGTWSLSSGGIAMEWSLKEPWTPRERMQHPDLASVDVPSVSHAHAAGDTLTLWPACQAPYAFTLRRAVEADRADISPLLAFVPVQGLHGEWRTSSGTRTARLTLNADGGFTLLHARRRLEDLGSETARQLTGRWEWSDHRRRLGLHGTKELWPGGKPSRYAPSSYEAAWKDGALTFRVGDDTIVLTRAREGGK